MAYLADKLHNFRQILFLLQDFVTLFKKVKFKISLSCLKNFWKFWRQFFELRQPFLKN
jgi:hypothetical protein